MASVHHMQDLLANMNPEIEAQLLGPQAEFSRLGLPQPFSADQASVPAPACTRAPLTCPLLCSSPR